MKPYRHIELSETEKCLLEDGFKNGNKSHFRTRCHAILLSSEGMRIDAISSLYKKRMETIRDWMNDWTTDGIKGLMIQQGRGRKATLNVGNITTVAIVKKKVKEQPIKLNSILEGISTALGVNVSKKILKKFLKKLGYTYRRIRKRLKKQPDPIEYARKVEELKTLIDLEKGAFLTIYYADESGFNETPCVPYGWQPKGDSLSIPTQKGSRLNVFGLMSRDNKLHTYTSTKSIDSDFVTKSIDDFIFNQPRQGRSVIIIDNAKIHHSEAFKSRIKEWEQNDVFIFYLPTYSPHLNLIETFWRKCKYEWLLPQHFDSWKAIQEQLNDIFINFGKKYKIDFAVV